MKGFRFHLSLWSVMLLICLPPAYIASQQPVFSFSRENFGISLFRGGYRSWHLHWCDGYELGHDRPKPVRIDKDGRIEGYGYRWIPRFSHADMRPILRWLGLSHKDGGPAGSMTVYSNRWIVADGTNAKADMDAWERSNRVSLLTNIFVTTNSVTNVAFTRRQLMRMFLGMKP